jgi:DNA-binding LacI/PurR family transcriptional regulator
MANMKDIAERAGVSVTTVSKVLNKQGSISPETTDNILRIAHELNYVPNMYARNLKKSETRVLGIITEDLTVFNASP